MRNIGREELLATLASLRPVFEQGGVKHLVLFGSRARADNRPDSDIDLMIEVDDNKKFSLLDLVGVGHIIEDNFGLEASVVMRRSISPRFAQETQKDLIEVF